MPIITPCLGYIKDTGTPKGRGVFAGRKISVGEVVEVCPIVILQSGWPGLSPELERLVFDWGYLTQKEPAICLALGWGSMYNHGNPANIRYVAVADKLQLHLISARVIEIDEEFTINYQSPGGGIISTKNEWFQSNGITPL